MKIRLLFITIAFLLVNTFCVAQDADIKKMKEKEMGEIADLIDQVLRNPNDEKIKQKVRKRVRKLTRKYKVK